MEISLGVLAYRILEVRKPLRSLICKMDGRLGRQVIINVTDATGLYSHAVLKKREFVVLVSLQHALVLAAITPLVLACRGAAV